MTNDRFIEENARLKERIRVLEEMVDRLLAHCDKEGGECCQCSTIVCPHKDPMHFHHDGCPSCEALTPTKKDER